MIKLEKLKARVEKAKAAIVKEEKREKDRKDKLQMLALRELSEQNPLDSSLQDDDDDDNDDSEDENNDNNESIVSNGEVIGYYRQHPEPNQGHPAFQNRINHNSNPSNQAQPYVPLHG